jgi:hypothetical protein
MSRRNRRPVKGARRAERAFRDAVADSADGGPAVVTPLMRAAAGYPSAEPPGSDPGLAMAVVIGRFTARSRAGILTRCEHLGAGDGGHWGTWAPGEVLCLACCGRAVMRTVGTPAAAACDACGHRPGPGEPRLRSVAAACEGVLLYADLCQECHLGGQGAATTKKEDQ